MNRISLISVLEALAFHIDLAKKELKSEADIRPTLMRVGDEMQLTQQIIQQHFQGTL